MNAKEYADKIREFQKTLEIHEDNPPKLFVDNRAVASITKFGKLIVTNTPMSSKEAKALANWILDMFPNE